MFFMNKKTADLLRFQKITMFFSQKRISGDPNVNTNYTMCSKPNSTNYLCKQNHTIKKQKKTKHSLGIRDCESTMKCVRLMVSLYYLRYQVIDFRPQLHMTGPWDFICSLRPKGSHSAGVCSTDQEC